MYDDHCWFSVGSIMLGLQPVRIFVAIDCPPLFSTFVAFCFFPVLSNNVLQYIFTVSTVLFLCWQPYSKSLNGLSPPSLYCRETHSTTVSSLKCYKSKFNRSAGGIPDWYLDASVVLATSSVAELGAWLARWIETLSWILSFLIEMVIVWAKVHEQTCRGRS